MCSKRFFTDERNSYGISLFGYYVTLTLSVVNERRRQELDPKRNARSFCSFVRASNDVPCRIVSEINRMRVSITVYLISGYYARTNRGQIVRVNRLWNKLVSNVRSKRRARYKLNAEYIRAYAPAYRLIQRIV